MLSVLSGRRAVLVACAVLMTVAMVSPATAQSTGMIRGKVVDTKGQPVDAAKVTIDAKDGISRTYTTKSNKKGEYTQIGLPPGNYKVTAARIEAITARGESAFDRYQLPLAILTLAQGLGRLIRHRQDRGVLAVLDPRVRSKGYGARFLEALPPAPIVTRLEEIARFFER